MGAAHAQTWRAGCLSAQSAGRCCAGQEGARCQQRSELLPLLQLHWLQLRRALLLSWAALLLLLLLLLLLHPCPLLLLQSWLEAWLLPP